MEPWSHEAMEPWERWSCHLGFSSCFLFGTKKKPTASDDDRVAT